MSWDELTGSQEVGGKLLVRLEVSTTSRMPWTHILLWEYS